MNPIRVILINEVRLIADLFASVLADEPGIEVVGMVATGDDALEFLEAHPVDVALVSADLPEHQALGFTQAAMGSYPSTKVLILGLAEENQHDTLRYIEAGAAGYILKDGSLKDLVNVIRLAHRGEAKVSTRMAGAMMSRLFRLARVFSAVENRMDEDVRLTARELEVLQFISQGLTNQEIAAQLVVEVGTVKNHVHRILEKLNVSSRQEAASYLAFIKK